MTKKKDAETATPPHARNGDCLMTKAEWEKVADANKRAEKNPDPEQITWTE